MTQLEKMCYIFIKKQLQKNVNVNKAINICVKKMNTLIKISHTKI